MHAFISTIICLTDFGNVKNMGTLMSPDLPVLRVNIWLVKLLTIMVTNLYAQSTLLHHMCYGVTLSEPHMIGVMTKLPIPMHMVGWLCMCGIMSSTCSSHNHKHATPGGWLFYCHACIVYVALSTGHPLMLHEKLGRPGS